MEIYSWVETENYSELQSLDLESAHLALEFAIQLRNPEIIKFLLEIYEYYPSNLKEMVSNVISDLPIFRFLLQQPQIQLLDLKARLIDLALDLDNLRAFYFLMTFYNLSPLRYYRVAIRKGSLNILRALTPRYNLTFQDLFLVPNMEILRFFLELPQFYDADLTPLLTGITDPEIVQYLKRRGQINWYRVGSGNTTNSNQYYSVPELKEVLTRLGVPFFSNSRKNELLELVEQFR